MTSTTAKKLPLISFNRALDDFKTMAQPLLRNREEEELNRILVRFTETDGKQLSERLNHYFKSLPNNKNWMAPFWKKMYLSIREPLYLDANYSLHITKPIHQDFNNRVDFITHWIRQVAKFYLTQLCNTKDHYTNSGRIHCNLNGRNLLGRYREPKAHIDQWITFDTTKIGIYYNGNFFTVTVIDENQRLISKSSLQKQIHTLLSTEKCHKASYLFTAVSSQGSEKTANFLNDFLQNTTNKTSYLQFASCICHITLVDDAFTSGKDVSEQTYLRKSCPLWPYMPVNFVLWCNNNISVFAEHTGADAGSLLHNIEVIESLDVANAGSDIDHLEKLPFQYSSKQLITLNNALKQYEKTISSFSSMCFDISLINTTYSYDTLAQLMFQYGMYKVEGQIHSIYAPSAMGHFREGRTEAVRSVSHESIHFIQSLLQGKFDPDALDKAASIYKQRIKQAKLAQASTRYLAGLRWMAKNNEETDYFYNSAAYKKLNQDYLCTSNLGSIGQPADYFFFAPPSGSRVGIGYLTDDRTIRLCLTYKAKDKDYIDKMVAAFKAFSEWFT